MKNKLLLITSISIILGGALFASVSLAKEERERAEVGKPTLYMDDNGDKATSSIKNDDQENKDESATSSNRKNDNNEISSEEHRSEVAQFVKTLLDVADRHEGIGEKVRLVAREQASSTDKVVEAMNTVRTRSNFKTFLIGTDYKNIGKIRSEIAQTKNRLSELNKELEKISTSTDKTSIENEIASLKVDQTKLEEFVKKFEGKFSLLGWFVKLFQ